MNPVDATFVRTALLPLAIATLSAVSCSEPIVENAASLNFSPPAEYATWWREVEDCLGIEASIERVRWQESGEYDFPCSTGRCAGAWFPDHRIVLARAWKRDPLVVRHEMIHDILRVSGHPSPPFGGACPSEKGATSASALAALTSVSPEQTWESVGIARLSSAH